MDKQQPRTASGNLVEDARTIDVDIVTLTCIRPRHGGRRSDKRAPMSYRIR